MSMFPMLLMRSRACARHGWDALPLEQFHWSGVSFQCRCSALSTQ